MAALWKQDVPLDPTFAAINASLRDDWFLLPFEIKLQGAHARALEAAGILTARERTAADPCTRGRARWTIGAGLSQVRRSSESVHKRQEAVAVFAKVPCSFRRNGVGIAAKPSEKDV